MGTEKQFLLLWNMQPVCCSGQGTRRKTESYRGLETLSSMIETYYKATYCKSEIGLNKYACEEWMLWMEV